MTYWTIDSTTDLDSYDQKKFSLERFQELGITLMPRMLHLVSSIECDSERHVISTRGQEQGGVLEICSYILITGEAMVLKNDPSGEVDLSCETGVQIVTSAQLRGQLREQEFVVIATEIWQSHVDRRGIRDRFMNAIADVAIARKENPSVSMTDEEAVREIQNLVKRGGH